MSSMTTGLWVEIEGQGLLNAGVENISAYCEWLNSVLIQPMQEPDHSNSSSLTENGAWSVIVTPFRERDRFFMGSENECYSLTPNRPRHKLSRAPSYDGPKSMEKFRYGYLQIQTDGAEWRSEMQPELWQVDWQACKQELWRVVL